MVEAKVALNIRVHPAKKAALTELAAKRRLDVTKLLMPLIDRFLEGHAKEVNSTTAYEEEDDALSLTGRIGFRPMPGDEAALKQYALKRGMTPGVAMKLILRAWINKNPPLAKHELSELAIASNQLALVGRNLNQLVKLSHKGEWPLSDDLKLLLNQVLTLTKETGYKFDAVIKVNQESWESNDA